METRIENMICTERQSDVTPVGDTALFIKGDCLDIPLADNSVDLVFCSPPYEAQRTYAELQFDKTGDDWVTWALPRFLEHLRVCRGLVAWVIEGRTENFVYSATPFLLMAELVRSGAKVRKPVVYQRMGIPGSGGPDWLRNDWEPIICATKGGKLPWSDNTAMGEPPVVYAKRYATRRGKNGERQNSRKKFAADARPPTKSKADGTDEIQWYTDPDIANPGNVIAGKVGGGHLGWKDAHENEAPFPEWLADFFVRSFCQPDGITLDPFSGSGTTVAAATKAGRRGIGMDLRDSQIWLSETRLMGLTVEERKQGQGCLFDGGTT